MKILIVNLDKGIFRAGSKSLDNLKDYSRFFDKFFIITWTLGREQPIFFENRLFIYPTNSRSRLFYVFDACKIFKKFIKKEGIDIISSQDSFETGFAAFLISRIFKIPLYLQSHTDVLSPYFWKESLANKIRVLMAKFLIPRASHIRVVSKRIKKSIVSELKILDSKISVLPIFVDVQKIREASVKISLREKYPQFDFIILMASRLTREKNIGLAIEAMAEITKKHPKTGLVIVGDGPEKENCSLLITRYGLRDNVIIEPWTDDPFSYYKTADLFLLTSNYEGYGMAVVEAMAAGCPVIMTDVGLAGEVLIDKKDGLVVPVGDKNKLTGAILNVMENQGLRADFIRNAARTLSFWPSREKYLAAYRNSWELRK